jgi:hypothetical protein
VQINRTSAEMTVDGTDTTAVHALPKGAGPIASKLVFGNITGLQGTLSASIDNGTTYYDVPCVTVAGTVYSSGGTIIATDGLALFILSIGYTHLKFTRTAGSGPVRFVDGASDGEMMAALHLSSSFGTSVTSVQGNAAHDAADTGSPVKVGGKAVAHSANPTAVAAGDRTDWYFNRAGVPFVIGGHPNPISISMLVADADGAQSNVAAVTVSAGTKIAVTRSSMKADGDNTGKINLLCGFGAATLGSPGTTPATQIIDHFPGCSAGNGSNQGNGGGLLSVGADGEDLRVTCEDPAGGNAQFGFTYFTIES